MGGPRALQQAGIIGSCAGDGAEVFLTDVVIKAAAHVSLSQWNISLCGVMESSYFAAREAHTQTHGFLS